MDRRAGTGEEEETVQGKESMCSLYIYACVTWNGRNRVTHHRTISKRKQYLRDTVFLLNLALRKGAEPGEERYLYFPLTPS